MHLPPDWGIFGTLIVSFLVFWFIFGGLFFKPFLQLIADREHRLKDLNANTERLLNEQKAAVERRETELAEVRREALAKREQERRAAQESAAHAIEQARNTARAELDKVRAGIEAEFAAAGRQLEELAGRLATELASRVLERPVTDSTQVRLNS
ncbi:MAG TPA: ATP synthase F0 subunit B [Candidatus Binataceae bacterium]|nr:ATP synthase F0 subunit B [Candidatus Binataceae bacterium]